MRKLRSLLLFPFRRTHVLCLIACWSVADQAAAATGGATQGTTILKNLNKLVASGGVFTETLAFVAGLGAALWGIHAATFGRRKRQAQEESLMVPVMAIVGGVLLSTIVYTMGSISSTLFGANQVDTSTITNNSSF